MRRIEDTFEGRGSQQFLKSTLKGRPLSFWFSFYDNGNPDQIVNFDCGIGHCYDHFSLICVFHLWVVGKLTMLVKQALWYGE